MRASLFSRSEIDLATAELSVPNDEKTSIGISSRVYTRTEEIRIIYTASDTVRDFNRNAE